MVTGMILLRKHGSSKDSLPTPTSSPSQIPSLASGARPRCLAMQYVRMTAHVTTPKSSSMMERQIAGPPLATCRKAGASRRSLRSPSSSAQRLPRSPPPRQILRRPQTKTMARQMETTPHHRTAETQHRTTTMTMMTELLPLPAPSSLSSSLPYSPGSTSPPKVANVKLK